jgi:hypothetical protein
MDNPLDVRGFERLGDLFRDRKCLIDRESTMRDPVSQRGTLDQLHDQCADTGAFLEAMDDRDIGMAQSGEKFGFPLEPGQAFCVGGHSGRENFDGDLTLEIRVGGPVDLTHPTDANLGVDFVRSEACARN